MKFLKNQVSEKINLFLFKTGIDAHEDSEVVENRENLVRPELENLAVTDETAERLKEAVAQVEKPSEVENLFFELPKRFELSDLKALKVKLGVIKENKSNRVKAAGSLVFWYAPDNPKLLRALLDNSQLVTNAIENKGAMRFLRNLEFFQAQNIGTEEDVKLARKLEAQVDQRLKARQNKPIEA